MLSYYATLCRPELTVSDSVPYTRMVSINELPESADQAISYSAESTFAAPPPPSPISESASKFLQLLLAFLTWIASCFFLLIVPAILALPYVIYKFTTEQGFRTESLATDKTLILLSLLGVIPAHALTIFVAWAVVTSWKKRPFWKTLQWSWPENFGLWRRISLAVLAVALLWLGSRVARVLGGGETEIDLLINSSFPARITLAFLAAATAPFVEEVIYRGVLYAALERAFGAVCAVLVVSVMFTGVHVVQYRNNLGVIAVISMLSVSLTLVRAFTGRLLPCFLMHLVFNGIQSIYIVLSPYLESTQHSDKAGLTIKTVALFIRQLG